MLRPAVPAFVVSLVAHATMVGGLVAYVGSRAGPGVPAAPPLADVETASIQVIEDPAPSAVTGTPEPGAGEAPRAVAADTTAAPAGAPAPSLEDEAPPTRPARPTIEKVLTPPPKRKPPIAKAEAPAETEPVKRRRRHVATTEAPAESRPKRRWQRPRPSVTERSEERVAAEAAKHAAKAPAVADAEREKLLAKAAIQAPPAQPAPTPAAEPPPPPPKVEAEPPKDRKKPEGEEAAATGDGSGGASSATWFKFARTSEIGGAAGAPTASPYIGDRNVSVAKAVRVATTTERSAGNGKGHGVALPTPKGHREDDKAPLARDLTPDASAAPVSGANTVAGGPSGATGSAVEAAVAGAPLPMGLHLSVAGEVSDEQVRAAHEADLVLTAPTPKPRRRPAKRAPTAKATPATAPTETKDLPPAVATAAPPTEAPAASAVSTPPVVPAAAEDAFWGGDAPEDGVANAGAGTAAADSPEARAGEDVKRSVFKKDGAGWTEITTLEDEVELGDAAAVGVRKTDLGVWFTGVDDMVRASWKPPIAELALGAEGRVLIEFTVLRNGKIRDVVMLDSNASKPMQQAAIDAVPAGVPRLPGSYGPLRVRYLFRYGSAEHPR